MKICISRIDKMGDMIFSLPVIKSIKIKNPIVKIYVLASHHNAKVLENLTYIDEIFIINANDKFKVLFKKLSKIRNLNFDLFINLSPTPLSYFFCYFSNSKKKAVMIFLSRYRKSIFSKLLIRIFSNIFCDYINTINRYVKLQKNEEVHQTKMIFDLIKMCKIPCDINTPIDISLPKEKQKLTNSKKALIMIHVTERWLNRFYNEENFIELILKLPTDKFVYVLTTDNSAKNKFKKIYDRFEIIYDEDFFSIKKLKENITILERLNYKKFLQVIYSSKQIITPECGTIHLAAACEIPTTIIYNSINDHEAINREYHPWKSKYKKLVFNDIKLNEKILNTLI